MREISDKQRAQKKTARDLRIFEEKHLSRKERKTQQMKSIQLHQLRDDPSGSSKRNNQGLSTISPNMPQGKSGRGIESYSALKDPETSPISNFFCKGYTELQRYPYENPYSKMFLNRDKARGQEAPSEHGDTAGSVTDIGARPR